MARQLAPFLIAGFILLAPFSALAANVNFFGPIIPDGTNGQPNCHCDEVKAEDGKSYPSAPDWSCVLATIQNAIALGITFILVLITFAIAFAGIMIMAQPDKPIHREEAKSALTNAILGLVIVLTAWLIVDFVMKALYNGSQAAQTIGYKASYLPWESIFSDDMSDETVCFIPKVPEKKPEDTGGRLSTGGTAQSPNAPAPGTTPINIPQNGVATKKPETPLGFRAGATGEKRVELSWRKAEDVDWYQIDVAKETSPGNGTAGTFTFLGHSDGLSAFSHDEKNDASITPGTFYFYRLWAMNEAGHSETSAKANAKTGGTAPSAGGATGSKCANCSLVTVAYAKKPGTSCGTATGCNVNGGCDDTSPKLNPPAPGCMMNSALYEKLQLAATSTGQITEMWPPTIDHDNECHGKGTCVDLTPKSMTDAGIIATAKALIAQGLHPVWEEDLTLEECQDFLKLFNSEGVTNIQIDMRKGNPHFSVYMNDVSNGCK